MEMSDVVQKSVQDGVVVLTLNRRIRAIAVGDGSPDRRARRSS
jgi:hypothetical protein